MRAFLLLASIVILLQYIIMQPHLRYGFADVDWSFLLSFKELSMVYHNPVSHFLNAWSRWGIYTYQVYYIGLIEKFFGMDYKNFQIVTNIFKVIATLSIYPVVLLITRSRLAAFLTTLIYAVAYSAVGVMYTVVTSGLFVAIPVMSLFLIWYWYLMHREQNTVLEILIAVILFFSTLLLATERMYPLIPSVILIEFFWWFREKFSRKVLIQIVKRLSVFAIVFLAIFLFKPPSLAVVSGNTGVTYEKFMQGNWQVGMSPLISFGSLFLPRDYWQYLGVPNIGGLFSYFGFLLNGPLFPFTIITIFLSAFLSKRKMRFVLNVLVSTFIFSILVYILSSHQLHIPEKFKMHFDMATIIPALIGGFAISLTIVMFKEWLNGGRRNSLIISMVGGIGLSLVFIMLTWVAADWILIFTGVHRYLTIPAIGSSLFLAGLMTIIFRKLNSLKITKPVAYLFLLLLIPFIMFNAKVIGDYFKYELEYAGTNAAGHIRMKNKLWSYLNNFSNTEASLFYFDESADHDNGYFDETTIMAGFNFWMRFRGREIVDAKLTPSLIRSNLVCQEERSTCLGKVREFVTTQNGVRGILYGDLFYRPENFYAFRFINRDIIDVKPEVVKIIGLE